MTRFANFQLAHFQTNLPDKWSRIVRTCTLVLALIVKWPLPCLKVAVIKVCPARVFSFWKRITEGFAVCASDRVKKGLPVWSTSRPRTCSPRRSWWRRMTAFRWAGQAYLQHFLYVCSEQWAGCLSSGNSCCSTSVLHWYTLMKVCTVRLPRYYSVTAQEAWCQTLNEGWRHWPELFFFFLFQHWKQ